MPKYDYRCEQCGPFEVTQKMSDPPLEQHSCGAKAARQIPQVSFSLKGGGWYADGYASAGSGEACTPNGCAKPGCAATSAN